MRKPVIIVRRMNALGDVILTTPIVRELRKRNPFAHIEIVTGYPNVFLRNAHNLIIASPSTPPYLDSMADVVIDLDLAYERRPSMHIVDAYAHVAFGEALPPEYCQQELSFFRARTMPSRTVAIHPAMAGWRSRSLPRSTWSTVVSNLKYYGFNPVLLGLPRDTNHVLGAPVVSTTNIDEIAQVIHGSCCFVGSDSSLLHVAGATDTPIVGIYTVADPRYRMPYRHGELGWKCEAVVPDLDCVFCLHRRQPPVTVEACEHFKDSIPQHVHTPCVTHISPASIIEAVLELVPG